MFVNVNTDSGATSDDKTSCCSEERKHQHQNSAINIKLFGSAAPEGEFRTGITSE